MQLLFFIVLWIPPLIFSDQKEEIVINWNKMLNTHRSECIKESGVNREDAIDIQRTITFPNDKNFKCYLKCQVQRLNMLDSEGNFDIPVILKTVAGTTEQINNKCLQEVSNENDLCNKAYDAAKCTTNEVIASLNKS
ncbi:hypothetical protein FQA39_LY16747 [Lamprigera yunnana]|nr:hypothetical protein FQA39_LY16747 [Lamprigera yunnana]